MSAKNMTAVSLFSSAGIGDLALRAAGVEVVVANELLDDRAALFRSNFPECEMLSGDIRSMKPAIIAESSRRLAGRELDILFATPPCQGMSKNGRGKLLSLARSGLRPELDPRNQLILDALDIAVALQPRIIVFENVPEMRDTLIAFDGDLCNVMDVIRKRLSPSYEGDDQIVEFADYGVPQRRKRLITVFSRDEGAKQALRSPQSSWLPPRSHAQHPTLLERPWISVLDAIGDMEPLDAARCRASSDPDLPLHKVPALDSDKYFWVSHTPPGRGAFDNQCSNPACGYTGNPLHGSAHRAGINQSNKDTPVRCVRCGELLPRPWVVRDGRHVIMSGFTSAYKRMRGDLPSSALTRNLSYACSDQKIHPTQNRVLSLHEALVLHTVSEFDYVWVRSDGKKVSDKLIREVVGESIPPRGLKVIFESICSLVGGDGIGEGGRDTQENTTPLL